MNDVTPEIVTLLADELGVRVSTARPPSPPEEFVMVYRSGGNSTRFVDNPRYLVHAWAGSDIDAAHLIQSASDVMLTLPDVIPNVAHATQDTMYRNDIDGAHRWSAAFVLVVNR